MPEEWFKIKSNNKKSIIKFKLQNAFRVIAKI